MIATAERADPLTQGWFNHGAEILALVERHRPLRCVELGTWLGASAAPVARAIRRWGGTLTCVDTWAGTVDGTALYRAPWMLASCARNLVAAEVSGNIRLIPATTLEAARWWTEPIDYLYVDADHTEASVLADLCAWVPYVRAGGLILGDDYDSDLYPGVKVAWDRYAASQQLTLATYQSDPPDPHGLQLVYMIKE